MIFEEPAYQFLELKFFDVVVAWCDRDNDDDCNVNGETINPTCLNSVLDYAYQERDCSGY
jgi:hypothetical protein